MNNTLAQGIFQSGFDSLQSIGDASVEEIMTLSGYEEKEKAKELIESAKKLVLEGKEILGEPEEEKSVAVKSSHSAQGKEKQKGVATSSTSSSSVSTSSNAKSRADKELKKAMAEMEKVEMTKGREVEKAQDN